MRASREDAFVRRTTVCQRRRRLESIWLAARPVNVAIRPPARRQCITARVGCSASTADVVGPSEVVASPVDLRREAAVSDGAAGGPGLHSTQ